MSQNIYDNPDFFEGYSQFRRSREGLAGAPEWHVLRSILPSVQGLRVLDLGCGFGAFSRWVREMGAESVIGVDLSKKMLDRAQSLTQDSRITYLLANIETLQLPAASVELVYSSLALHYVENFKAVCAMIRQLLVPDGHFIFSVEHPIFTAPSNPEWITNATGGKIWPLNNYFLEGKRITNWVTSGVQKQHRTISHYVNRLLDQGFQIIHLEEWGPNQQQISEQPDWSDELHRPLFLLIGTQLQLREPIK